MFIASIKFNQPTRIIIEIKYNINAISQAASNGWFSGCKQKPLYSQIETKRENFLQYI